MVERQRTVDLDHFPSARVRLRRFIEKREGAFRGGQPALQALGNIGNPLDRREQQQHAC